ncbi:regulatory protein RecX [Kitasatospora sp. NPDC093806]|uniref:regulatory protein RecX n=1 Tax=Kitasatospora sp. NPDC093806 TaxID=3155075 RepID=UPI003426ACC9
MTQHSGPAGPEDDDDYGPPDWFAAVAEPEPGPEPEPAPRSGREPGPRRARAAGRAPDRSADAADLGLVAASELPTGRRRRRSALAAEEAPGHPAGGGAGVGAAGHGGVAAPAAAAPEARARRRSTRTRRGGLPDDTDPSTAGQSAVGQAEAGPSGGRRARAEEPVDPESRARDICLRLLTGAAKSRKQLADALRKREIPDEVADEVLTRLEEVGLIDDAAFAQAWVESRHSVRGLSRRALAQELRTKGVTGELAERALAQLDHDDETEAARALVDRKLRTTRGLERQTRTRRLVGMLARRGYSEGLAFRVVREALDEEGSAEESTESSWD